MLQAYNTLKGTRTQAFDGCFVEYETARSVGELLNSDVFSNLTKSSRKAVDCSTCVARVAHLCESHCDSKGLLEQLRDVSCHVHKDGNTLAGNALRKTKRFRYLLCNFAACDTLFFLSLSHLGAL